MQLEKHFDVRKPRDAVARVVAQDDTLLNLFPDTEVEIVECEGPRRTVVTRYTALGKPGTATFHFTFESGGDVVFEKVCDGNVWRELRGAVTLTERGKGTRVRIETRGRTKALIPEFTIRGPMQDQIDQMAGTLRTRIAEQA